IWRRSDLPWRGNQRSFIGESLRLPGDESHWVCRSENTCEGYNPRQIASKQNHKRSCSWLQLLWKSNRTCNWSGCRNISPWLCGETDGSGRSPVSYTHLTLPTKRIV